MSSMVVMKTLSHAALVATGNPWQPKELSLEETCDIIEMAAYDVVA